MTLRLVLVMTQTATVLNGKFLKLVKVRYYIPRNQPFTSREFRQQIKHQKVQTIQDRNAEKPEYDDNDDDEERPQKFKNEFTGRFGDDYIHQLELQNDLNKEIDDLNVLTAFNKYSTLF